MDFTFSVVMAVYNKQDYIAEAIESIINQSLDFKDNIQIVIVNDKSTDGTLNVLEKYQRRYPDNILLITNDRNMGPSYSRNQGLKHVKGEFINFLDSDDTISKDAFMHAMNFLNDNLEVDIASIPIYFFGVKRGPHNLNFKFEKDQVINLAENPQYIQLSGPSSFIRAKRLKDYSFNDNLKVSEDALLLNQMLLENPHIGFLAGDRYNYRKDGSQNSLITSSANTRTYFTSRVDEYFIKLIHYAERDGKIPKFIQYVLMYDLQWILEIEDVGHLLSEDEIKTLYDKLIEILSFIDEDVILAQPSIPAHLRAHAILIKRHCWDYFNHKAEINDNFKLTTLFVDNIQFKSDQELYISGILVNFTKDTSIRAVLDGETIETQEVSYPQRDFKSLGFKYAENHNFKVNLEFKENSTIAFKSGEKDLAINFSQTSRLSKVGRYMASKKHIAVFEDNQITIRKKSFLRLLKLEISTLRGMLKNRQEGWRTGVLIRMFYVLTYPFLIRRRIWIYMDLPQVAGDNGLELFKYVSTQHDKINHYFVLDKSPIDDAEYLTGSKAIKFRRMFGRIPESKQYRQIKGIGKIIPARSLKHRVYTLFAEFIITSHPDNTIIYPFWGNYPYVAGLARSKTVFLQHGVIKNDISSWANEYDKPLAMFLTSSEREAESLMEYDYGYDESVIKTLGLPRFDRLENDPKKDILVMPSWRKQFNEFTQDEFAATNFCRILNELISDDELIEKLTEKGYRMIFKPHRNLHKFAGAFTTHPDVKFDLDLTNYTETFNTASLLISDYSSVSFDFAYMKKPVIYYQFDKDYHFDVDDAYFKYEDDGFGPVAKNHAQISEIILEMIDNDCRMDEKYAKRVDGFFKYHDRNNSKRVYEEILDLDAYY
ncbi:CDP-glycerol:glycerophosphate glycerophosphotransferase [Methanobrevibacter sp.]|uniref:CDP-glycerol:glycerophosphate glycerophosphotransferase n=1 Tax=Methanobrevibacter sp. TaxID=66852 RepID=UPI0025F1B11B|nr:CDP-glycerol glycerophosphotransferase family protein [Methanobrevibacter sp.]MBQ2831597.1 CDP-glycerol glycerophosphotransferase family protein [Methanobrevibacter sp.]